LENEITYPYIQSFLFEIMKSSDPLLAEMEKYAAKRYIPIIQPESSRLLETLSMLIKPRRILEVGTAIGYSSIILARTLGSSGAVDTIEIDEDIAKIAREYIKRAGLENVIRLIIGDAAEVLQCLGGMYDLIFLDAAKGKYPEFFSFCFGLLNRGGLLITDNILYKGMVAKQGFIEHKHRTITVRLKEFINELLSNKELLTSIIPIGDGVAVSYKY
jgi:predicted O-methyltransferase YrrM